MCDSLTDALPADMMSEYAALFAHTGAAPDDWRTVALVLAERHVPDVLSGVPRRRPGAPVVWDDTRENAVYRAVVALQAASAAGTVRRDLSTITAACQFLTEDTAEARAWRERGSIPEGIAAETLRNRVSSIRSRLRRSGFTET